MMKFLSFIFLFLTISYAKANVTTPCIIYWDYEPSFEKMESFPRACEHRIKYSLFDKDTIGPLEEGTHCRVEYESRSYGPDQFNCGTNDVGLPNQAYYNVLHLSCQEIGPSPDYTVYRRWSEEKKIFDGCVVI